MTLSDFSLFLTILTVYLLLWANIFTESPVKALNSRSWILVVRSIPLLEEPILQSYSMFSLKIRTIKQNEHFEIVQVTTVKILLETEVFIKKDFDKKLFKVIFAK